MAGNRSVLAGPSLYGTSRMSIRAADWSIIDEVRRRAGTEHGEIELPGVGAR